MSPVRFLQNTTLPAPIIATLITGVSPPLAEHEQFAGQRHARRLEFAQCDDHTPCREVPGAVVVKPGDENAWVVAARRDHQVVERLEVAMVSGKEHALLSDGVAQYDRVR